VSLARSIVTGFNGTSMPGYSLPSGAEQGIWDLAAYLRSLQRPEPAASATSPNTAAIGGSWRTPIPRQGSGADLSAASCASCHPLQFLDWSRSRHAGAMGPGVWSQLHEQPELAPACNRCHAPLEDQAISPYLAADGVSCSACHSRGHAKFGPPPTPRTLLSIVAPYPAPHGPTGVRDFFEKAEFCAACHQFRQGEAQLVDGSFLQNTLEEWRGSRAARDGKSCQTCHMPDRRHFFRGIHDPETVRQGVKWTFDARTESRRVVARMTLTNAGSGHDFPTYVVPEVWMRIEVRDQRGVLRARSERLVARKMSFARGEWRQLSDTRLRADETATLEHAGPLPEGTSTLIGSVVVVPDAWHLESLAARLRDARSETSRRYYEAALAEANQSAYTLFRTERRLP
jgi:mono/diheme cytochrome c family protein